MNFFTKITLKATDRNLYHKKMREEQDQQFLTKANTNQVNFPDKIKPSYSFKHSGNSGDIIYSLPTVYALAENSSIELYLNINEKINPDKYVLLK